MGPSRNSDLPRVAVFSIVAASMLLAGCADYLVHRDTVTLAAGNAKNANAAIHTVDPQAHRADNTLIYADGKYIRNVIDLYHERPTPPAAPAPGLPIVINSN